MVHHWIMEPVADPLPSMDPHEPTSIRRLSGSSSPLNSSLMSALSHDDGIERDDGDGNLHKSEVCPNNLRKQRSSAFPSSLTWDSDSERETFDEEELQEYSNPHGLAAQSPGSPTCGQDQDRLDCEVYHTHEKPKNLHLDNDLACPLEGHDQGRGDTYVEPRMAQSSTQQLAVGALLSEIKPKDGYQKGKEQEKGVKDQKKKEIKRAPERDVYTFPGDSDPESPPPGPWAHCTFIQRRRKKRALLRPFSGIGSWQRTLGIGRKTRVTATKAKECGKSVKDEGGVFEFTEEEEEKVPDIEKQKGSREQLSQEIFTCVECSVYFKKRAHLQEHMRDHGQVEGKTGNRGEDGSGRRRAKKSGFECMECGQNFADRLVLVDHHRLHQESRRNILEKMETLEEGGKKTTEKDSYRNCKQPDTKEPSTTCGQFVCLKCNYSSDVAQELADHAKTHTTRARSKAAVRRSLTRRQHKSRKKRQARNSGNAAPTSSERYLTRASVQGLENRPKVDHLLPTECGAQDDNVTDIFPEPLQNHIDPENPAEPTDEQELASAKTDGSFPAGPSLQEEPGFTEVGDAEKNIPNSQSPEPLLSNKKATRKRKNVAFKSSVNLRSRRVVRGKMRRTRASSRLDPKPTDTSDTTNQIQNTDDTTEQSETAVLPAVPQPEPEIDTMPANQGDSLVDVEPPAVDTVLSSSPPPKTSEEFTKESHEETALDNAIDGCSKNDTNPKDIDEEDEEDDDSNEEDVVNCLLNVLNEEEDEEDGEGMSMSIGKKCPYCQDCFDNGIGLANHIRGHLNRVGVSYKVRHFISPEEVNAIEKKFSYQKKKKKVANFDPSTFSVMRCEFCSAGFDTRAGLSSHARAHLRDFGITNWEVTSSPINVLRELFSKHPELALSVPHIFNSESQEPESSKEAEEESGTSDPALQVPETTTLPWKEECSDTEAEGGDKKEDGEFEKVPPLDHLTSCPGSNTSTFSLQPGPSDTEETEPEGSNLLKCEVCNTVFETRRGLSSHARSHLRQLGVGVSETSGAPIDLLYQITKEQDVDASLPSSPLSHPPTPTARNPLHASPNPTSLGVDAEFEDEPEDIKPPLPLSVMESVAKASTSPSSPSPSGSRPSSPFGKSLSPSLSRSRSPSPVLRKAPISSLLPVSSLLRSHEHKILSRTHNAGLSTTQSRPHWAQQETDSPLNLTMDVDPNEDIICKLCGAWFETRKGLSSHARAHLRHFGVEYSESKGSPIDLLDTLILTDDFKHRATVLSDSPEDLRIHAHNMASRSPLTSTSSASKKSFSSNSLFFKTAPLRGSVGAKATSSSSSSSARSLPSPPAKKLKASTQHVFRMSGMELMSIPLVEPMKDVGCEFCGEVFENRKGLSSHARSHLRQLGITEWSVNGSPIDTLRDLIARRGLPCVMPLKSSLKSPSSSPSPGPPRTLLNFSSSSDGVSSRLPFSQHQSAVYKLPVSALATSTSPTVLMVKPKEEPEQMEVTMTGPQIEGHEVYTSESLQPTWMSTDNVHPVNLVITQEREPSRDIRCEFCGEFFENRKGLSSHARSHLRHMGITEWSVNGSPIDTLWEVMRNQGTAPASMVSGLKEEPGQDGMPAWEGQVYQSPKVSQKSPLSLLHSGSRLHKHGLGPSTTLTRKLYNMAPIGKRVLGTKKNLSERSMPTKNKTFSPPPQDFSFKGRISTDKHGVNHMDASCELCGFAFENRKALASHARAHLRQFGVTEWSVNGSPIETLSAWMRSRPETVAELHRSYQTGGHSVPKKKTSLSLSTFSEPKSMATPKHSASQWTSTTLSQGRTVEHGSVNKSWGSLSRAVEVKNGSSISFRHGISAQGRGHHSNCAHPHAQVARSELNVRVPRGIERRPLKHPSHADGGERESCPPKTPRTSSVPALVPKPSSTPLVKLVGKIYSLKCRFCEVEFHGPLSVQEDWIRHLQQHILKLDYNKPAPTTSNTPTQPDTDAPAAQASATSATTTTTTATTTATATPASAMAPNPTHLLTPCPSVSGLTALPTSTLTSLVPPVVSPGSPITAEQQVFTS